METPVETGGESLGAHPGETERGPRTSNGQPGRVTVVTPVNVVSHPLPPSGILRVGRDTRCDLTLDDPRVSREHALIHIDDELRIEDLESANGTWLCGSQVQSGQKVPLRPGQVVEIGDSLLLLQRAGPSTPRRLCSHAHFEARLEDACRTSSGRSFCVLRIHIEDGAPAPVLRKTLSAPLGASDIIATFAPGAYELLLMDATLERGETVARTLRSSLADDGIRARLGVAAFPRDARSAHALLAQAAERLEPRRTARSAVVIRSPAMRDLYRVVDRVARGQISVLLTGETGVGKEVVATAVHRGSPRAGGPFIPINCAAFSESMVEAQLFGHEKGAFTGADAQRPGLLETAAGGTVFLDELGELTPGTQAKILRTLEQKEVFRVGGVRPVAIDVRFIAATNRDLEQEIELGRFRKDLYYRLGGVTLRIPPLRERVEEIAPMAEAFGLHFAEQLEREPPELSAEAIRLLEAYEWPGNIRELRNTMECAVLMGATDIIEARHLPVDKLSVAWTGADRAQPGPAGDEDPDKDRILEALAACGGNQTRAARILGISRRTLTTRLNRYGDIPRPKKKPS